jgi:hypothetical protein
MMEAARTSETSVDIQLRTRQYIPEDTELQLSNCLGYLNFLTNINRYPLKKQFYISTDLAKWRIITTELLHSAHFGSIVYRSS